jgi:hypothetical protein
MLVGAKELAAFGSNGSEPSRMGFLGGGERTEVDLLTLDVSVCREAAVSPSHAARPLTPIKRPVPSVLLTRCLPQIAPAVVRTVKIGVIKMGWPFTGLHGPDNAMREQSVAVHANADIPFVIRGVHVGKGKSAVPCVLCMRALEMVQWARLPRQQSSGRVIRETLVQVGG